jgi:GrpB-like predicted nucleotidyltransferase (UPF0157 family)
MPIRILPANPDWPDHFARVKAALRSALPPDALIHHIGSTAVPGLQAKDIIDIQITLPVLTDLNHPAIAALGFTRRRPTTDHCPPGLVLLPADLAKHLYGTSAPIAANIHIRAAGRFNQRYPLLCRDYLRAHPHAAAAYGAIKQNLAARFPEDTEAYYAIKDPVFDLIMAGAEDWARATGWVPPAGD